MADLISIVKDFLVEYELQDKTVIVGFSGGYDSMCLLDILSKIRQEKEFYDMTIIAAHFNHNWRGEEALREQEVCRLFAASRGVEFYTKTANIGLKKSENEARIARYDFFEDVLEYYDADAVLTAHNKDDNAETVLYRAIKGTGIYGLQGISPRRESFYRPLLTVSRYDILEYCNSNNLAPNNDSSNADTKYRRNFIRLNILPVLEKINPMVKESLNSLAEVATSENLIIKEYLDLIKEKVILEEGFVSSEFKKLSVPVQRRLIHELIQKIGLDYDFKRIKEIHQFILNNIDKRNGSTISLSSSLWLYVDEKIIERIPHRKSEFKEDFNIVIDSEGEYKLGELRFVLRPYTSKEIFVFPESTAKFAYVDLSKVKMPLVLRNRKDGDIINPFGMNGTMKLKKYLNSKGVSKHRRDELLLLANEDEILWVVGVGLSDKIAVTTNPTHVIEVI